VNWELRTPAPFEQAALLRPNDIREAVLIPGDLSRHAAWLAECALLGFASLNLHNVGTNRRAFLDAFGRHVLPALRRTET
jgi:coenzyme F420-dependent glucose-6-phosphate dehydrogenase